MKECPSEITVCRLQVIVMPNGEVICFGKTVGMFRDLKEYITAEVK